jgi:peptidoglycan/LPS O-acetylase OafA/YrhL
LQQAYDALTGGCPSRNETGGAPLPIEATTTRRRFEALDLLRAVAILAVLLFHYTFRGAAADGFTTISVPALIPITKYGFLGVQLFFVISGFVIAYSAEERAALSFAIARVARIYPAFVFCMTATFLVTLAASEPRFAASTVEWLANLFIFAPALKQPFMDSAYWSIADEIIFYGWMFAFMVVSPLRRKIDSAVLAWLIISTINETFLQSTLLRRLFITDQSGFFCAGLALYEIFRGRRSPTVILMLCLSCLVAVDQALKSAAWARLHYTVDLSSMAIVGIVLASIAAVAIATYVRMPRASRNLLTGVGSVTYPLYLLHQYVGFMLLNRFSGQVPSGLLITLVTVSLIVASFLVWRFVERPAQQWLKDSLTTGSQHLFHQIKSEVVS